MLVLLSAVAFFLLVTGLVLIHEVGHFIAARLSGVEVEEFGFGLPPRAMTMFRWKGTKFTLNWFPFGGFVRLKGEGSPDEKERTQKGSFMHASIAARCFILVAGVGMNFLLAFVIFTYGFSAGQWIPTYLTFDDLEAAGARHEVQLKLGVVIDDVLAGGGAADAGIKPHTLLIAVDHQAVTRAEDAILKQKSKRQVVYTVQEGSESQLRDVTVAVEAGKTGVYLSTTPTLLTAPLRSLSEALALSAREVRVVTVRTVVGIWELVSSLAHFAKVPEGVSGIVGIAQITYVSVKQGFMVYLRLVALLSLSLAVFNILPFPALDGGRLVFVLKEAIFGRTPRRVEALANAVGLMLLLSIIIIVTLFDVFRLVF